MSLNDPRGRLAGWTMLIQQFDFDIVHRPGKSNGNADALSRRLCDTCSLNALDSAGLQSDSVFRYQRKDPDLAELIEYLEEERLPSDKIRARQILLKEDIYFLD